MAKIIPFRGYRYNPAKIDIGKVVTKPYDKISLSEQADYYNADDHNIVRVILGKGSDTDTDKNNRYTRAACYLNDWIREEIFIREDKPCMYLFDQEFSVEGKGVLARRALVALCKVEPYSAKVVFPHEKTLSGPKKDRLDLTIATQAQFGHIFMLYDDKEDKINSSIGTSGAELLYTVKDKLGITHRFSRISDDTLIKCIQSVMADKKLLIADGHHRYETAINYRNIMLNNAPFGTDTPFDYHMMSFVNINDPGLVILPTHRVVKNIDSTLLKTWQSKIPEFFDVSREPAGKFNPFDLKSGKVKFALYAGGNEIDVLTLRDTESAKALMSANKPDAWYELSVTVLHELVLDKFLGICPEKLALQSNITYAAGVDEAQSLVRDGSHQLAFFLPPTEIGKVCDISFSGETMPQKTTDFYPKIYTGFVFNSLKG